VNKQTISKAESKWLFWFTVLVLAITSIPYLLGYFRQGADWRFTGFIFGVEDGNSYIAKMLNGAAGDWLFKTPYTAYPQNGFLAFLPYILLGKLTAAPGQHEQLVFLYQLFRWFAGFLMIRATYDFVTLFIEDISLRKLGTAVIILGGGVGWLAFLGLGFLWKDGLPLEFYSPESFGFLSLLGLPHLALARAMMLWGLCYYLRPTTGKSKILDFIKNNGVWFLMGLVQPLTIVTGWAVILAHFGLLGIIGLWKKRKGAPIVEMNWRPYLNRALGVFIVSVPFVVYNLVAFLIYPFLKEWAAQNIIISPPILDYLLAYLLLLPFVVWGIVKTFQNISSESLLVTGWVLIFPFLAAAPTNLQRRLPEGVWAALVILALLGLLKSGTRIKILWQLAGGLSLISSILLVLGIIMALWAPAIPLYRPKTEIEVFKYLDSNAKAGQVVLASPIISNALPAWVPLHTLVGHGPESIHNKEIMPKVNAFLRDELTDAEARVLLDEFQVEYIILTKESSGIVSSLAHVVFKNDAYTLYEVNR
jgi:hypothetical protein